LFDHGDSTADLDFPSAPPSLTDDERLAAIALCQSAKVPLEWLDSCVIDVGSTDERSLCAWERSKCPTPPPCVNGSFEEGSVDPGAWFSRLGPGSTQITGWQVAGAAVDYTGTLWQASKGVRSVDLDGNVDDAGAVQQTCTTSARHRYH